MSNLISKLITALLTLSILSSSCNDENGTIEQNMYPKEVTITYKASSTNATTAQAISYKNESGNMTTVTNVALPYSKTITRVVNLNDDASVGYSIANINANVSLEILVDNTVKKSQNFTSGTGSIVYLFQ